MFQARKRTTLLKELMHQCSEIGAVRWGIVSIFRFMGAVSAANAYRLVSPLIPKSTIAQIVRDTVISWNLRPHWFTLYWLAWWAARSPVSWVICASVNKLTPWRSWASITKSYLIMPKIAADRNHPFVGGGHGAGIYGGRRWRAFRLASRPRKPMMRAFWRISSHYNAFCPGQSLYVRIHHQFDPGILWLLRQRRVAGDPGATALRRLW